MGTVNVGNKTVRTHRRTPAAALSAIVLVGCVLLIALTDFHVTSKIGLAFVAFAALAAFLHFATRQSFYYCDNCHEAYGGDLPPDAGSHHRCPRCTLILREMEVTQENLAHIRGRHEEERLDSQKSDSLVARILSALLGERRW